MPQPRSLLITILALVLVAVGVGAPMTSIPVLTHAVALAMPGALAIPIGVPPVWLPGGEPLLMWSANLLAAAVMVLAVWRYLVKPRAAGATRGRAWRRVFVGTIIGLVLANVIRAVVWSFYTGPSITIYAATIGLSAVVSAVVGALLGAVIGAIAAAAMPRNHRAPV